MTPPGVTLASITVAPSPVVLTAGQVRALTAQAIGSDGQQIAGASGFTFTSANNDVVTAFSSGSIIGLSAGTAQITVSLTLNGVTKSATVDATVTGTLPNTVGVVAGTGTNTFTPQVAAIARTGTVTWTFGSVIHNVDFQGTGGAPANVPNSQSESVDRQFNTSGTFQYLCTLHGGMNGTIIVK